MTSTLILIHQRYVKFQSPLGVEMDAKLIQTAWKMEERNARKILDAVELHGIDLGKSKL